MSTQRTIVCGSDFTESAHAAMDLAATLAAAMAARVEVIHVLDVSGPVWRDGASRTRAITEAELALADEVARVAAAHGVEVGARVVTGSPAVRLVQTAEELGAALIVVGAVGPTRSIFRVGGTAERVAQAAHVPVLLVRDPGPLRGWLRGEGLAIAALIGGDSASDHVIEWLRALRRIRACDVSVLHAYYADEAGQRFGLRPATVVDHDAELEGHLRRELVERVGELGGEGALEHVPVLALGRLADHLIEHPAARGAGLVVVGNHRSHGVARYASVASGVILLSEVSVLVVPADAPHLARADWPRYRRVLVATDLSSFSADAVRHAYGLAAGSRGEVVLLHVVPADTADTTRATLQRELRRQVPEVAPAGVTTRVELALASDAAAGIVQAAARVGADCIVIASHGRSGVRRLVLGSVAQAVAHKSDRPVLIVRPPADA